jgi:hypothetical protein
MPWQRSITVFAAVLAVLAVFSASASYAKVELSLFAYGPPTMRFGTLAREVAHRTSLELATLPLSWPPSSLSIKGDGPSALDEAWLWVRDPQTVTTTSGKLRPEALIWLRRGGFLIIETAMADEALPRLTAGLNIGVEQEGPHGWQAIPPDHELMRSFYLLDALPPCGGRVWRGFHFDGRLAILVVPYGFLASIKDAPESVPCANSPDQERSVRIFVNLVMVALATDYKKDQIHLPEILKRLR